MASAMEIWIPKCGAENAPLGMSSQGLHPGPHAWWRTLGHGFLVCALGCLVSNGHEAQFFFHMEELP